MSNFNEIAIVAMTAAMAGLVGCELPPSDIPPPDQSGWVIVDAGHLPTHFPDGGAPPDLGPPFAFLVFEVDDDDTGLPMPSRVIFRPVPGAGFADNILTGVPDPLSPGGGVGKVIGPGVLGSNEGVMLVNGTGVVPVPPGTYTLFVNRGPEYEAATVAVTVVEGETKSVHARLPHSVDTRGWLSADMHIHMARSYDAKLATDRRVINEVTNHVELLVPTDHNTITDLSSDLLSLGYGPEVAGSLPGNEFNFAEGHGGAYPLPYDSTQMLGGAPPYQANCAAQPILGINCYSAVDAFALARTQSPSLAVITVNHPFWPGGDLGYFTNIGWGSGTASPLPSSLVSAGLFDALEVLNGYQASEQVISHLVADWFFLLGQGLRVTALGNSDTHRLNWLRGGWPRTWLRLPVDNPGDVTPAMLSEALKNGRAVASTGPFLGLKVDGADIGDDVKPKTAGQVTIAITVDAPSWMQVDKVRLYVNGELRRDLSIPANQRPVFVGSFVELLTTDAWVVVEASGQKALPADVVGEVLASSGSPMRPYALTNPVFVDTDGNGIFSPPPSMFRSPFKKLHQGSGGPAPPECSPELMQNGGAEPPLDGPDWLWELSRRKMSPDDAWLRRWSEGGLR